MSNDSNETIIALYYKLGEIARQVEAMRDKIARLYLGDVYATRPNEVGTTVEVPSWPDFPGDLWGFERARYEAWLKSVEGHMVNRQIADTINGIFGDDDSDGASHEQV